MTLDFAAWLAGNAESIDEDERAIGAWSRIQRDPHSLTVKRAGVIQSAITVRIEHDNGGANTNRGETRISVTGRVIVFGIRNHPSLSDTDIQMGDRFVWERREYEVKSVRPVPGEVQALAEVME